jgi:N-sulfoglucosamine sulfohydrolase
MYDLKKDPECVRNLANDLFYKQTVEGMQYRMMAMLKEEQDPRALGNGEIFDSYKYVGGRAKAYDTWLKEQESNLAEIVKVKAEERGKKANKKKKKEAEN